MLGVRNLNPAPPQQAFSRPVVRAEPPSAHPHHAAMSTSFGRSCASAMLLIALLAPCVAAQPAAPSSAPTDSIRQQRPSWTVLPNLFYTPETRLAGGVAGLYFFRPAGTPDSAQSSRLLGALIYTQNSQIIAQAAPDLYLQGGALRIEGDVQYVRFPDTFYGVGNDTPEAAAEDFTAGTFAVEAVAERRVMPGLAVGPSLAFASQQMIDHEAGGLLQTGTLPGSDGGRLLTLGGVIVSDTRDHTMNAHRGHLAELSMSWSSRALGSDFDFGRYRLDLRQFVPLGGGRVLAVQGLASYAPGTVPFSQMPMLGGQNLLRGLFAGRYRDQSLVAAQAEVRLPLWRWFGGAAFAGVGEVAPAPGDLTIDGLHLTGGFGLRFSVNEAERVNIRIDYGIGPGGSTGTYITLGEAF